MILERLPGLDCVQTSVIYLIMGQQIASPQTKLSSKSPKTTSPVKEMIPSKVLIPLLVILLLVVSVIARYLAYQNYQLKKKMEMITIEQCLIEAKPSPSPYLSATPIPVSITGSPENWLTYSNEKQSYSIKYPPQSHPKELETDNSTRSTIFYFEELNENDILPKPHAGVTVSENEGLSLLAWFEKHSTNKPFEWGQEVTEENSDIYYWGIKNIRITNIKGGTALQFEEGARAHNTITSDGKKIYSIYYFMPVEKYKDTYKLMLATFDFIK